MLPVVAFTCPCATHTGHNVERVLGWIAIAVVVVSIALAVARRRAARRRS